MKLNAGLDPIIAIIVGVGWFVVKALMNRRQDADSWDDAERPAAPRPHLPERNQGAPPPRIPQTAPPPPRPAPVILSSERRPTQPPAPAPLVRTISPPRPIIIRQPESPATPDLAKLQQSRESYARAAGL